MSFRAMTMKAAAVAATLGLVGFMFVLRATTQNAYAQWGPGLHHPELLANAMTLVPIPLIAFTAFLVVVDPGKGVRQARLALRMGFWALLLQAFAFACIPLLLVVFEGVLNAGAIIVSVACISFALVLALLFAAVSSHLSPDSHG